MRVRTTWVMTGSPLALRPLVVDRYNVESYEDIGNMPPSSINIGTTKSQVVIVVTTDIRNAIHNDPDFGNPAVIQEDQID